MILENELLQLALGMAQAVLLLLCAPLVTGIVKKVKAWMQNRIGSSIWQEYYDTRKWWGKPTMLTPYTSITFRLAPCVYFLTTFAAACMLPGFLGGQAGFGDVFVFVYLLALGRFFMAVSSMDAATAFGGMGGSSAQKGPRKGADLRYDLTIDFEEAVFGTEKTITIPRWDSCDACGGTGAKKGTSPTTKSEAKRS